jgi:two-component sensor histidine kinase
MFAGNNALLYFDPKSFQNKRPADVMITDFKLLNNYVSLDSLLSLPGIRLNNNQNTFSIYFSTLSYLDREKLTYYYKMTGIDKEWIKAERQNVINYSLLPPGKYRFEVYCENIDGSRSKNITSLGLYIKPPFYRTYWFISLLILLVSMGIYLVHRLRVNKLLAVEKLRTRVARDLHDDMGSTLSTINILSSMAKSRINIDPVKTTEYIGKISDNSQRMMDAMDDIVWSIKPTNDTMQKVVARMREFANSVLEAKEIDLRFLVDERIMDVKLNMEQRRDLFLIFKEAVNNAAKYSKAANVTIHIGLHSKRMVMQVADDGTGFDPLRADNGNGLANMQKRAGLLGGRLHIQSKQEQGTKVILNIPVT